MPPERDLGVVVDIVTAARQTVASRRGVRRVRVFGPAPAGPYAN